MSIKIQEHKAFDEIDEFLSNPLNTINVEDQETNSLIKYTKDNKTFSNWSKQVINERYGSILDFFNTLSDKGYKDLNVNLRKSNGSNSTVSGGNIKVRLHNNTMMRKSGADYDAPYSQQGASNHALNNNNQPMNTQHTNGLGAIGFASQQAGLGFNELVDLKAKAKAYDELEASHKELKKRYDKLEIDKQSLESQVATAEREKNLAVKEAELGQKSFADSDGFAKIIEAVPSLAGMIMEAKKGAPLPTGLGTPETNVSEAKQQVIEFIKSDLVSDEQAERFFSTVLYHMSQTPEFSEDLTELVKKYTN